MDVLQEVASDVFCSRLDLPEVPSRIYVDAALFISISLPHFLYAYIWFQPQGWHSLLGKQAVSAFGMVAWGLKLVQFEACLLWLWSGRSQGLCLDLSAIQLWQWLAALLLVAFGQSLNVGIYKAIGHDGVYYGFKLGKVIPWVTGFPFNVVPHPQYVGSVLTVWGVLLALFNQFPAGSAMQGNILVIGAYWALMYLVTGIKEQYL